MNRQNKNEPNNGIRIRGLTKSFPSRTDPRESKTVFDHADLFFPSGRLTCIMGKSGCGKTTLLRILMGLDTPDAGEITGIPERISAVFQEDRLLPEFSVLTNVLLPLSAKTKEEKKEQHRTAAALLARVDLGDSLQKKAKDLSGGMSRRVALVRALLAEHELLILDEPLKGLDECTKERVIGLLKEETGTVLMVTHDPEEARLLGADIVRL